MKKRRIRSWVLVVIGFVSGIIYSNMFIYSDLIKKVYAEENNKIVQTIKEEENNAQEQNKSEIKEDLEETTECELDEISCKIKEVADDYGIDYKLAIAISKHETGSYTSYAFKELNNVGGMMYWNGSKMQLKYFENLENGIDAFVSNLKYNYIDLGLDTIEKIQPKYAPIGINDNGLNQYWVSGVNKYYEEVK